MVCVNAAKRLEVKISQSAMALTLIEKQILIIVSNPIPKICNKSIRSNKIGYNNTYKINNWQMTEMTSQFSNLDHKLVQSQGSIV